jgi:hypothetical protein
VSITLRPALRSAASGATRSCCHEILNEGVADGVPEDEVEFAWRGGGSGPGEHLVLDQAQLGFGRFAECEPEFFVEFAAERGAQVFAGFDVAAGEGVVGPAGRSRRMSAIFSLLTMRAAARILMVVNGAVLVAAMTARMPRGTDGAGESCPVSFGLGWS